MMSNHLDSGGVNGFVKELLSSYWRKQGAFGKEIGRIASA